MDKENLVPGVRRSGRRKSMRLASTTSTVAVGSGGGGGGVLTPKKKVMNRNVVGGAKSSSASVKKKTSLLQRHVLRGNEKELFLLGDDAGSERHRLVESVKDDPTSVEAWSALFANTEAVPSSSGGAGGGGKDKQLHFLYRKALSNCIPYGEFNDVEAYVVMQCEYAALQARVKSLQDARCTFAYLKSQKIGLKSHVFYARRAEVERNAGNDAVALEILAEGAAVLGCPVLETNGSSSSGGSNDEGEGEGEDEDEDDDMTVSFKPPVVVNEMAKNGGCSDDDDEEDSTVSFKSGAFESAMRALEQEGDHPEIKRGDFTCSDEENENTVQLNFRAGKARKPLAAKAAAVKTATSKATKATGGRRAKAEAEKGGGEEDDEEEDVSFRPRSTQSSAQTAARREAKVKAKARDAAANTRASKSKSKVAAENDEEADSTVSFNPRTIAAHVSKSSSSSTAVAKAAKAAPDGPSTTMNRRRRLLQSRLGSGSIGGCSRVARVAKATDEDKDEDEDDTVSFKVGGKSGGGNCKPTSGGGGGGGGGGKRAEKKCGGAEMEDDEDDDTVKLNLAQKSSVNSRGFSHILSWQPRTFGDKKEMAPSSGLPLAMIDEEPPSPTSTRKSNASDLSQCSLTSSSKDIDDTVSFKPRVPRGAAPRTSTGSNASSGSSGSNRPQDTGGWDVTAENNTQATPCRASYSSLSRSSLDGAAAGTGPFSGIMHAKNVVHVNGQPYLKLNVIGRGGSSKVFRVLSPDGKMFALKRIRLQSAESQSATALESYKNEITLLQRLRGSPNIVELVDSEIDLVGRVIHMVMEFGEVDLNHLLSRQRKGGQGLSPNFIRLTWQQMLEAVDAIHEERIVHGDLKPANFLFVQGKLKLIDFGIAKAISNDTTHIARESQVGTLNYMCPESLLDTGASGTGRPCMKLSRAADIWSLGCILYQMVYGCTPFAELSLIQKLQCIINPQHQIKYPSIEDVALLDTMQSCLRREPLSRPPITGASGLLRHPFLDPQPGGDGSGSAGEAGAGAGAGQVVSPAGLCVAIDAAVDAVVKSLEERGLMMDKEKLMADVIERTSSRIVAVPKPPPTKRQQEEQAALESKVLPQSLKDDINKRQQLRSVAAGDGYRVSELPEKSSAELDSVRDVLQRQLNKMRSNIRGENGESDSMGDRTMGDDTNMSWTFGNPL